MADAKNLTPDEEALSEQIEMMTELRHKGWVIDRRFGETSLVAVKEFVARFGLELEEDTCHGRR